MFPLFACAQMDAMVFFFLRHGQHLEVKLDRSEVFGSAYSHTVCLCSFRREYFEHDCSTQTNSKAEALWDHGASSACWRILETHQPARVPGEEAF